MPHSKTPLRDRLSTYATLILLPALLLAPVEALAEIILDDFTDAATVVVQSFVNPSTVTENVGELRARRELRFATGGADPMASFDVNVTSAGRMNAQVQKLVRRISGTPLSAVQFNSLLKKSFCVGFQ